MIRIAVVQCADNVMYVGEHRELMLIRIAMVQCADNVMYVGEHRELMLVWRRICVDTLDTRSAASGVKAILR